MANKESAQSFYRVAVEAAFQGNPSITSTHALGVSLLEKTYV